MVCIIKFLFVEDLEWKVNFFCCEEYEKNFSFVFVFWYDLFLCIYLWIFICMCLFVDIRVGYIVINVGVLFIYRIYLECSVKCVYIYILLEILLIKWCV